MKTIDKYIIKKQIKLAKHPLFIQITKENSLENMRLLAQYLSFWVMSFQDIIRINEMQITDSKIHKIAHHHLVEDMGHEQWFLSDLQEMKVEEPNLKLLYSRDYVFTRDATYAIISEVFRASSDVERVALIMSLESTGRIFFQYTASLVKRVGYSSKLKYFSIHHLDIEKNHELFEQEMQKFLNSIHLSEDEEEKICGIVDRVYQAFTIMFDGFKLLLSKQSQVKALLS
ncbi:MAG: hypothetical protein RMZ43_004760 [Nostoc sp. CmiVER01]|uniref:hypothetical protein n=1 Tax=Nostoc sp. CmiVER01 TaxID=3075384 RepID=UPI002AD52B6D|nr:hypothetical protein [Nostoc sp. CmiVER01]MDZ8124402.1 hypothetical protein [Nostoc sp. CmiVER01]